jgi:hypothetical protein
MLRRRTRNVLMGERLLSPEELAALFRRLDGLIAEARMLQKQISEGLLSTRRRDQQDRSGQPRPERRRRPRPKPK